MSRQILKIILQACVFILKHFSSVVQKLLTTEILQSQQWVYYSI